MDFGLKGRRILITGASSGLGAHFAHRLAKEGAVLALAARRSDRLERALPELDAAGAARTVALSLDVTSEESVTAAVAAAADALGGLDVLVNNAGIADTAKALDVTAASFDRVVDTNLRGAWLMATESARLMAAQGGGAIVNIASILGLRISGGVAPYAISKAGVVQMTKTLALELARERIRVNAIAPGYIETEINRDFFATEAGQAMIRRIPMRRLGQPEDLDGPLLLLCSEASRFMTGAVIAVDGGHLVSPL